MKVIYILLGSLLLTSFASAQSVSKRDLKKYQKAKEESKAENSIIISYDTVLYAGKPQMVMLFDKSKFFPDEFKVKNLHSDEELIIIKDVTNGNNEYYFPTYQHQKAYVKQDAQADDIAETIINRRLLSAEGLNKENVKAFIADNPKLKKGVIHRAVDDLFEDDVEYQDKEMVERNREAPVLNNDRLIIQDNKEIGYYKVSQGRYNEAAARVVKVYFKSGQLCATATFPNNKPGTCIINIAGDDTTVEIDANTDAEAFQYLVDRFYL